MHTEKKKNNLRKLEKDIIANTVEIRKQSNRLWTFFSIYFLLLILICWKLKLT